MPNFRERFTANAEEFDQIMTEMLAENERLERLAENLKQQAISQSMEARSMTSIVHEIYQALGIQKGNWNGARPVVEQYRLLEILRDEKIKDISTEFFYSWHNSPGTNTLQGFDAWWTLNKKRFV